MRRPVVAVLGMHRSGTSATIGLAQEQGVELGDVSERNRFNPRGNREIRALVRVHEEILGRNGGSWWDPPSEVRLRPDDFRRRNEILESIPGEVIGVKDPRMLLLLELWRDLDLRPIGVIRNPVSVRRSLEARAKERPKAHPQLAGEAWEELWCRYNEALLRELEREPFPIVNFDRQDEIAAQVRAALESHGIGASGRSGFFAPEFAGHSVADWREEVLSPRALQIWDELVSRSLSHRPG